MSEILPQEDQIDAELLISEPLTAAMLDAIRDCLASLAPDWAREVRRGVSEGDRGVRVDFQVAGALHAALDPARQRLKRRGLATGGVTTWFEGATDDFEMQVEASERVLKRSGAAFANGVGFIVSRRTVEGQPAPDWLWHVMTRITQVLPVAYGFARAFAEFAATNNEPPVLRGTPVGIDLSRHLPGLYWLNCFGAPYLDLMGRERLRSAPASRVAVCPSAVILAIDESPWRWRTPEYQQRRLACIQYVGADLFFDRAAPDRPSRVPPLVLTNESVAPSTRPNYSYAERWP